jgi:nucleotide-binding universal stress UspA family protein
MADRVTPLKHHEGPVVVAGVDGSQASLRALHWAVEHARRTDATLRVVTAWEWPILFGPVIFTESFDPKADAERTQVHALEQELGEGSPVKLEALVVEGRPAPTVLDASDDAELLVVGSRGRGAFAGMLLGSVSEHCVHHATCPVVVVP